MQMLCSAYTFDKQVTVAAPTNQTLGADMHIAARFGESSMNEWLPMCTLLLHSAQDSLNLTPNRIPTTAVSVCTFYDSCKLPNSSHVFKEIQPKFAYESSLRHT